MPKFFLIALLPLLATLAVFSCSDSNHADAGSDGDSETDSAINSDANSGTDSGSHGDGEPTIAFDPPSGTYTGSIAVEITAAIDYPIHYTTNGTTPTPSSPEYSDAIAITGATQINAAIFVGDVVSAQKTAVYIPRAAEISGDLPIVILDNAGGGEAGDDYSNVLFMAFETNNGIANISSGADVATGAGFHLRGQSSKSFEKRPYRIELRDATGADEDFEVLGMPAESDWILRNPYVDKALIRDAFHYTLGRKIGMEAPRFRFVELYKNIDGDAVAPDDYEGVYLLMETIKNCKNRLDLKALDPLDTDSERISGGYIFKAEWRAAEAPLIPCPVTGDPACWAYSDPSSSAGGWGGFLMLPSGVEVVDPFDIQPAQMDWIANYLFDFSTALHGTSLNDSGGYGQYIDARSFADQVIINEIGRELDAYIRSAYFYKDRDDVVFAGPLWDYNLSLGTGYESATLENLNTEGWMYDVNEAGRNDPSIDWFFVMVKDPVFQTLLKDRWGELRNGEMSDSALNSLIDELAASLGTSPERNFDRWDILGSVALGSAGFHSPVSSTWEEQIDILKDWLTNRLAWMDGQWR